MLKDDRLSGSKHDTFAYVMLAILASVFMSPYVFAVEEPPKKIHKIAIIMDDIGAKPLDKRAFKLSQKITFAILPNTEYSTDFSHWASEQNREVLLHMPMESLHGEELGQGPLLANMYPYELAQNLTAALESVPHAVGINNHMGSRLTQMTLPMQTVMQVLSQSNLFFVDSKTTKYSKATNIAQEFGVNSATRHVFLDHIKSEAFINGQMQKLINVARSKGEAIGIAHPYSITLKTMPQLLANLPDDIELVTVSSLLNEQSKFRHRPELASLGLQSAAHVQTTIQE